MYENKVVLIVNVACQCGYTTQNYQELAQLLKDHYNDGLRILLFPCNQFAKQEPGSPEQIKALVWDYTNQYGVSFDVFEKVLVNGSDAIPLYQYLKSKCKGLLTNAVKWNFTKFLVNRQGIPVDRFWPRRKSESIRG